MSSASSGLDRRELVSLPTQLSAVCAFGYLASPLAGFGLAHVFGIAAHRAWATWDGAIAVILGVIFGLAAAAFYYAMLAPVTRWLRQYPGVSGAPPQFSSRIRGFTRYYWLGLGVCVLVSTAEYFTSVWVGGSTSAWSAAASFGLLQLVSALLVGMPGYLVANNLLGRLISHTGIEHVHVRFKHKLLVLVGFIPILCSTVLLQYYWWKTGFLGFDTVLLWAVLAALTLLIAAVAIRGMSQALAPVQRLLEAGEVTSAAIFSAVRPRSTDEIGYLTQLLAGLLRRIWDQDEQVRAIVDTAAEGIIVVDSSGRVVKFNRAAEQLFGYQSFEVEKRPLAWLLPAVVSQDGVPRLSDGEQDVYGINSRGRKVPMSVRVSQMQLSGQTMYTCLVADVSERKAAAKSIRSAEERYRHLVETAHDLVWSMDLEGRWTYLNKAARLIYGVPPRELLNRPAVEFAADDHRERDEQAFAQVLEGKDLVHYETVHMDCHGTAHHLSFNARVYKNAEGTPIGISGTARDITEQKAFERQLAYQAQHDSLTGLANRRYFEKELKRLLARVSRSGASCALFYIDLDQFKYINDTLGHAAGDRLLVEFSTQLKTHLREGDLLSRFGGDEFTVLLYNVDSVAAMRVAENVRSLVEDYRFLEAGNVYTVSCSIGVAMVDSTVHTVDECMAHADLACHLAKNQGRNRCYLFRAEDHDKAGMEADMGWAARLRKTLENDRLRVVYQPIARISDGTVKDYEVLVRMEADDGQVILPGGFMPAAERFGLISSVDRWMVQRSIASLGRLQQGGEAVRFSINLSARAFEDPGLLPLICRCLEETGVRPQSVTFEITETATIGNLSSAIEFIRQVKEMGCQFALDDFGSGFSSFTYLKHLPVDKLKIDGSFVQNMAHSSVDQAMVKSMTQVAHALGKITIAEFVENEETLALLKEYGVDYAQGYYLGKPRNQVVETDSMRSEPMPPARMLQ